MGNVQPDMICVEFTREDFVGLACYLQGSIERLEEAAQYYAEKDDQPALTDATRQHRNLKKWLACMYGTETA